MYYHKPRKWNHSSNNYRANNSFISVASYNSIILADIRLRVLELIIRKLAKSNRTIGQD